MKFEDKLIILRKNKKMSQEQLADELSVSRQAVSKWESGSSYPEMDKLIQIAKIFECTLDDLTNDQVSMEKINSKKEKNPLNDITNEVADIINKSVKMFSSMKEKEIISLLFFMFLVGLGISFLQVPLNKIYELGENFFMNFGEKPGLILSGFWEFILGVIYIVAAIMVFFYIYKVKYLDKFKENKTVENENIIEEKESKNIQKKEIDKSTKEKHSWGVLKILGTIFMFLLKCCCFFFAIPFIIMYIFIVFGLILSIYLTINGVFIFGLILLLIAAITLTSLFLELVFDFIFNKDIGSKKRLFIKFIISLGVLGIGFGITAIEVSDYKIVNDIPEYYEINSYVKEKDFNDDLYLNSIYNVEYVVDNNLTDKIKIQVNYYKEMSTPAINFYDNCIHVVSMDDEFSMDFIKNTIKDLKEKTIFNYDLLTHYKTIVYTSEDNINKLKTNYQNQAIANEEYYNEIESYQDEIARLQQEIYELEQEQNIDDDALEECEYKLNEYKENIRGMLEE